MKNKKKKFFFFFKNKNNLLSKKLSTKRIKYDIFIDMKDTFSMIHDKKKNILIINGNHPSNFIKDGNIYKYINVSKIKKIRNGTSYTLLLTKDNKLFSFGDNENGQCGIDNIKYPIVHSPIEINFPFFTGENKIKDLYCFDKTSYILLKNNEVYFFGEKKNNYKPQKLIMNKNVDEIEKIIPSQSLSSFLFLTKTGKIYVDDLHIATIEKNNLKSFYNSYNNNIYILYEDNIIYEIDIYEYQQYQNKIFNIPIKIKGDIIKILYNISMYIILTTKGVYLFKHKVNHVLFGDIQNKNEKKFFRDKKIIDFELTTSNAMAVSKNGIVYGWGYNDGVLRFSKNPEIYESPIILYKS